MIEHHFRQFLKKFHDGQPLLLALSGGPDSTCLFHLLLKYHIPFEVAHVNHHWREESSEEATQLKIRCEKLNIPFHMHELNLKGSNIEDKCREARFAFFKQVIGNRQMPILLGHHAGDLAETVLKRVFEGARVHKLSGLRPLSIFEGMTLWRPLLNIPKERILNWLHENNLSYFIDATNLQDQYLRGRMRTSLIPLLEETFGKNIQTALVRLAEEAALLVDHIEQTHQPFQPTFETDSIRLDFSKRQPISDYEWQHVISTFFERHSQTISRAAVCQIIDHLKRGRFERVLRLKNGYVKLQRQLLILYPSNKGCSI